MMRGGPRKKKVKLPKYPCHSLSPEHIKTLENQYTPPLTAKEIFEKESIASPDRSHVKPKKNHKAKSKNG